jgi:hypothetical protein
MSMTRQTQTQNDKPDSHPVRRIAGAIFVVAEVVLAFRLVFELLGANANNTFAHGIYATTQFFVGIFESIFARVAIGAAGSSAFFEPATLIAMGAIVLIFLVFRKLTTLNDPSSVEN